MLKRDNPMVEGKISFGRFRLDLARRELRRDQTLVLLGSRALDILRVLASAEGKVVTKDELMERVWAGVVVEENNLQVHISALRKALEEDGDSESWIVTVPGRGYRLLPAPEPPNVGNAAAEPSAAVPLGCDSTELYAPLWSCHKAPPIGFGAGKTRSGG